MQVLLDPHNGYLANPTSAPLVIVVALLRALFAAFAAASVSFWGFFRPRARQQPSQ